MPRDLTSEALTTTCPNTMASRFSSSASGLSAAKSKAAKAPRHTLSLKEKYDAIDTSNKNPGMGSRALAAMFSCGKTQITSILNNKESIAELYESNMSMLTRKRCRESDYSPVNEALYSWYLLATSRNTVGAGF